jgi:hypothetical protein
MKALPWIAVVVVLLLLATNPTRQSHWDAIGDPTNPHFGAIFQGLNALGVANAVSRGGFTLSPAFECTEYRDFYVFSLTTYSGVEARRNLDPSDWPSISGILTFGILGHVFIVSTPPPPSEEFWGKRTP